MRCRFFLYPKPTTTVAAAFLVLLITLLCFLSTPTNADHDHDINKDPFPRHCHHVCFPSAASSLRTCRKAQCFPAQHSHHCRSSHDSLHHHVSSPPLRLPLQVYATSGPPVSANLRKNSGIDRAVIESFSVFRFGSLRGHKGKLDCAVCLTRFEPTEFLRLLPKCKHAFHVECVDTWLDAHSTCPLCRYRVDPEDILLIEDVRTLQHQNNSQPQTP